MNMSSGQDLKVFDYLLKGHTILTLSTASGLLSREQIKSVSLSIMGIDTGTAQYERLRASFDLSGVEEGL